MQRHPNPLNRTPPEPERVIFRSGSSLYIIGDVTRHATNGVMQCVLFPNLHAATIIGDPKTPAGKRKMLILPGLLETLELSQSELNDPEAYVLPSLDDPHTPLSFQADRRLWERVKKSINVYGKTPTVSGILKSQSLFLRHFAIQSSVE